MPTDYLVTDTELTSIANAIRTKGGTVASLSFPTGFINAIGDISCGPSDTDAIIAVSFPTESTITATKGNVTITPTVWLEAGDNTLDYALFIITSDLFDDQNAWTVTVTDGTHTVNKTVIVDSSDMYEVKIRFEYYVFKEGSGFQNGFSMTTSDMFYSDSYIYNTGNGHSSQGSKMYISPSINMANYDILYVDWQHATSTNTPRFGIYDSATTDAYFTSYVQRPSANVRGTDSIDVSILTGNYYVKSWGNYSNNTFIYSIWLL